MNGQNFHYSDDYIAVMAWERRSRLLDEAAHQRAVRAGKQNTTRTRPRFLRWH